MAKTLYTVVEEPEVTEALFDAIQIDARVEDIFDALVWRLARQPESGNLVEQDGVEYRVVKSLPLRLGKTPSMLMLYQFNESFVMVKKIVVLPYDEAQAYSPPEFDIR